MPPGREEVDEDPPKDASEADHARGREAFPTPDRHCADPGLCPAAGAGWKPHVCSDETGTKLPETFLQGTGNGILDPPQFTLLK